MEVQCPNCGETVEVNGLGRKSLNIPLKNILDALQTYRSVAAAAEKLGCSRSYIFNALKTKGLNLKGVIQDESR